MGFKPYMGGLYWEYDERTSAPAKFKTTSTATSDEPVTIKVPNWGKDENIINSPLSVEPIRYGWVCPLCGKANAPWLAQCNCTDVSVTSITSNVSVDCAFKKPIEQTCENCKGSSDLCYYCKNGDHWEYKGWEK